MNISKKTVEQIMMCAIHTVGFYTGMHELHMITVCHAWAEMYANAMYPH